MLALYNISIFIQCVLEKMEATITKLPEEMLTNAGIEQHFHFYTMCAGKNGSRVRKIVILPSRQFLQEIKLDVTEINCVIYMDVHSFCI